LAVKHTVVIDQLALDETLLQIDYYRDEKLYKKADTLKEKADTALENLESFPFMGPVHDDLLQTRKIKVLDYYYYYKVVDKIVRVYSFKHSSRSF